MFLIVGLGNPGRKFQKTRHNIGFLVIDEFVKKNNFPEFKFSRKFNALISEGKFNNEKIIIAQPQTFMNDSGKSVRALISFYKIINPSLVVIHDDIDLPLGKIRIVKNRGAGGHRGVESIIKEIKARNFVRLRVGIQPKSGKPKKAEIFVLQKFNNEEEKIIKEVIKKTVEALEMALENSLEKVMNKFNK